MAALPLQWASRHQVHADETVAWAEDQKLGQARPEFCFPMKASVSAGATPLLQLTRPGSPAESRSEFRFPMGAGALGLLAGEPQIRSPALAEIMGGRRLWTVSMISAVSIPSR
jgi:hypothetical protein